MKNLGKVTKEEELSFQEFLDECVRDGHLERDDLGRYHMTAEGKIFWAAMHILELVTSKPESAFTFGALVKGTGLDADHVADGLISLIRDGSMDFGEIDSSPPVHTFYLFNDLSSMPVFSALDESPSNAKFQDHVDRVLKAIGWQSIREGLT